MLDGPRSGAVTPGTTDLPFLLTRLLAAYGHRHFQRERSVKPSASPTLVRTQHLPLPAETARDLGIFRVRGSSCVVSSSVIAGQETSLHHAGYGHIDDMHRARLN